MKFLIDMNLSPLWVTFLAERGYEAAHWSTIGEPWAADSEIFDFAAANDGSFSRTTSISACYWPRYGRTDPASFKFAHRMFYPQPSGI